MFRIFYAEKDATIYESVPDYNAGLDEVLEIGKRLDTDGANIVKSRATIQFNTAEISDALVKYSKTIDDCKIVLQLYTSHAKNLPSSYTINTKLIAQPWENGTGTAMTLTTDGVSWTYPLSGSSWFSSSQLEQIGTSTLYASGSGLGGSWMYQSNPTGWTNGFVASESFSYRTTDINLDVTDSVKLWLSGSDGEDIPNYGFLLQLSDEDEAINTQSVIAYFSRDTHTIYVPRLTMYFDNSTYDTGSLTAADLDSYTVYTHIKPIYKDTEVARIRIYARDKYPRKSPTNLFPIETVKYLPETTYYAVYDASTDEAIIPYDNIYNKVSCDSTSNYIHIDMNGFMPERYYRLEFKIIDGLIEQYITDDIYFKVVR